VNPLSKSSVFLSKSGSKPSCGVPDERVRVKLPGRFRAGTMPGQGGYIAFEREFYWDAGLLPAIGEREFCFVWFVDS